MDEVRAAFQHNLRAPAETVEKTGKILENVRIEAEEWPEAIAEVRDTVVPQLRMWLRRLRRLRPAFGIMWLMWRVRFRTARGNVRYRTLWRNPRVLWARLQSLGVLTLIALTALWNARRVIAILVTLGALVYGTVRFGPEILREVEQFGEEIRRTLGLMNINQ